MANRVKEDEKNEKIIRGLLKLPANRKCINCNNLGPQYVCTNFWTFVCTNCSGIHREFTHRVKSVSMAKFTSQEVTALQEGGNERAREIYFKDWDPQRHSFPDSSNIDRLREFVKHVYVDRRYSGERPGDMSQRLKGDRDENENKREESYRGGSRSPPYESGYSPSFGGKNEDRSYRSNYGGRSPGSNFGRRSPGSNFGGRNPGYNQGDIKRSPAYFEVVDDRVKDDKFRNGNQNRRIEERRLPDMPKPDVKSPDHQKDIGKLSTPMVRPASDILGDDVPRLQVGNTPKSNGTSIPDDSAQTKSSLSSSSIGSADANSVQKGAYIESLIDFSVDSEPTVAANLEQSVPQQNTSVASNGGDWAAFNSGHQSVPQVAPIANQLVSGLAQLSVSGSVPSGNNLILPSGIVSTKVGGGGSLSTVTTQQALFPSINNSDQSSSAPRIESSNNLVEKLMSSPAPHGQGGSITAGFANPGGHLPRVATKAPQDTVTGVSSQPSSAGIISSGRKELPEDIFASLYPTAPLSAPIWQRGFYPGMGYNMQYPTTASVVVPTFTQSPKSMNPFDITSGPLPMVTPLQGEVSNMTPPGSIPQSSSFQSPSPHWMASQQSPYASHMLPSPFAISQFPNSMTPQIANATLSMGNQRVLSGSNGNGTTFGTSDQNQPFSYNQPNTHNSFAPVGSNPFG
ncbi:probable ADP-ribosylation factor GTPase-activating protein AGD14 isoform X1 [Zingiber officinale]|uniref:probable ADP-ribosylation factor GTPase-activating protein AGD14 isoform X1 n=1 Tax=Zingiber officinale TaxID=94328 RepID=UPI001C4DB50F|nr:probable ADP-ribosylation factor GTPase-activating protein AGD14 isoform X1 [Zingiber officinale]